jgi:hypothetical protein
VTYPNNIAASGIPISIQALVTVGGRQEGAHGNKQRIKNYQTDENGRNVHTLDIPAGATDLKITVSIKVIFL